MRGLSHRHRVAGVVGSGPRDNARLVPYLFAHGFEQRDFLFVGGRRGFARRACED